MANRRLSDRESSGVRRILDNARAAIARLAGDDSELEFAARRKLYKELSYDDATRV